MNAMQQNSVNKDNKAKKTLVTSVSVAALAVGLSFPFGAAVLGNAQSGDSQMGGAPGAEQPTTAESQKKSDALAVVKRAYDFRPVGDDQQSQFEANIKANTSDQYYLRYTEDKKVLKYNSFLQGQDYAQYTTYGPAYVNGDTVYVAVGQYADKEGTVKQRDLVVSVDVATNKIIGVGGEYK